MAKILVIDDDPDILTSARYVLEAASHEVFEAKNGTEGLAKIVSEHPHLIILDVMMDTTTEGFQLTLQLRNPDPASKYAEFSRIPILMLTSIHSTTPLRFSPTEDYLPVDEFVDKPIDPDELLAKVDALLKKQAPS